MGVFDVGVERHDAGVGVAEGFEGEAEGAAGGELFRLGIGFGEFGIGFQGGGETDDGVGGAWVGGGEGRGDGEGFVQGSGVEIGDAEFGCAVVEFGEGGGEFVLGDGGAVMAHAGEVGDAPAFDGFGDDAEGFVGAAVGEGGFDFGGVVAVDDPGGPAEGFGLALEVLPVFGVGHEVALAQRVAVEDGDDAVELMVGDEVHGFPDLALAGFAVADDAVDGFVDAVDAGGGGEAGGDGEAHAEGAGGGVEEGEAEDRVGVAVDGGADGAQGHEVVMGHRAGLVVGGDGDAEIGAGARR